MRSTLSGEFAEAGQEGGAGCFSVSRSIALEGEILKKSKNCKGTQSNSRAEHGDN